MRVSFYAETVPASMQTTKERMTLAGRMAGICYMPGDCDEIFSEPEEKTLNRAEGCKKNAHHSVFQHTSITLLIERIPKILAMVLNNENVYNTSEKSGRYTFMKNSYEQDLPPEERTRERELYEKWHPQFAAKISELYPRMKPGDAKKLAMENARFLLSAFTPATSMSHTTSLCQWNYYLDWMNKFIQQTPDERPEGCPYDFGERLAKVYSDFREELVPLVDLPGLNDPKGREFSLFARRVRANEWGENYCTTYMGTLVHIAQALRHRTLDYEITLPRHYPQFYVPEFIADTELKDEWLRDIGSLADDYPLGMLVRINERGTLENFVLKLQERFCGHAQVEICKATHNTLLTYYSNVRGYVLDGRSVYRPALELLEKHLDKSVCRFEGLNHVCNNPCYCGPDGIFTRKV